ncbi:MAG TPA: hypothetical protein VGA37_10800 [Gemmatimonadales bacterium]
MIVPAQWVDDRLAGAPPSLCDRIRLAIDRHGLDLRRSADAVLREALSAAPSRETAVTLLAADALVTLACEYAAEVRPDVLGGLQ